jgi:hypothetical protein
VPSPISGPGATALPTAPAAGTPSAAAPSLDPLGGLGTSWTDGFGVAPAAQPAAPRPSGLGTAAGSSFGVVGARSFQQAQGSLPASAGLGVATIHRYQDPRVVPSTIAITVFTPLPTDAFPGQVLDMNAKSFAQVIPRRAILGDAGRSRAFIGVDHRPGTPLDLKLEAIEAKIPKGADGQPALEPTLEWLRKNVNSLIQWTAGSSFNDGRAEFPWDKAIQLPPGVDASFSSVAFEPVGHAPQKAADAFPVVPFERYLDAGKGYCIQKALLAALILERLGFPCRLVNGAVARGPGTTVGHTWIELPDGRVFDPAWSKIETPSPDKDPMFPDRFKFGGSWRFVNQTYPYVGWAG